MAFLQSQRSRLSFLRLLLLALGGLSLPASAQELAQVGNTACRSMGPKVVLGICAITLIGTFAGLIAVRQRLGKEGWSLANAISEPTRLTIPIDPRWSQSQGDKEADANLPRGASLVAPGAAGKEGAPVGLTILEASSSRLIALVGMIVILLVYLAFGVFALYTFGLTCQMPASTASVTSFLYAGLTLFAPYVANKVSGILQPVLGSKPLPPPETAGTRLGAQAAASPTSVGPEASLLSPREAVASRAAETVATGMGAASQDCAAPIRKPIGASPTHRSWPAPPSPSAADPRPISTSETRPGSGSMAPAATPPLNRPPEPSGPNPSRAAADPYEPAAALIAQFEGFVDHAYPDPASGGDPWTIGYGFTSLQDRPVQPGDTISEAEAKLQLGRVSKPAASTWPAPSLLGLAWPPTSAAP
jgi:hypothetical protein